MKICPHCNAEYSTDLEVCPSCGTNYIEATINAISDNTATSIAENSHEGAEFDGDEVLLQTIEGELSVLDAITPPRFGETFAQMAMVVWGAAALVTTAVAVLLAAPILYMVATIFIVLLFYKLMRRRKAMCKSEADVAIISRIFNEDLSRMKESFLQREDIVQRIGEVRSRLNEAEAIISEAHQRNRRKIFIVIAVVASLFAVGVGVLAFAQYKVRKAEAAEIAAFEAIPEWQKVRDGYFGSKYDDEYTGNQARYVVIATMLEAGATAEAEEFFFAESMGKVGDYDCALLIAKHYDSKGDSEAAEKFVGKLKLRYDSDNTKIRTR